MPGRKKKGTARRKQKIRGAKESDMFRLKYGEDKIRMELDDGDFKTGAGNRSR